ncbi:extracellular solute-binding protein [Paenibacillus cymbidii]|uniref:extracellular solute-binding protein n=1 Tax=Paenibacillus cymbidii TaxID=1639034 RepID=UPI0010812967|nr:extracellular solute-binding protein [Paenibacillus cymbidii]
MSASKRKWNGNTWRRRTALAAVVVSVAGLSLAGCSSKDNASGTSGSSASSKPAAPVTITMMNTLWVTESPKTTSDAMQIIQKTTGANLDINWVPGATYTDKLNATIASGEMPQVLMVGIPFDKSPGFINAVRSGMFWEIGPYLKDYPNLNKMTASIVANSSIDGKTYGIYRGRPQALDGGLIIRKDWLDKLGMKAPTTIDEWYNTMVAMKTKDPDGNGKEDTVAFAEHNEAKLLTWAITMYGGPNKWQQKDGKFTPDFMTPAYKQAINFVKKLYDEKLMNQDFATLQQNQKKDLFFGGKAAMYEAAVSDAALSTKALEQNQVDLVTGISGPGGPKIPAQPGYDGLYVFPKTKVKTEADLKAILSYFDKLAGPEVTNLLSWGIEGQHYKMDGGKPVTTEAKKFEDEINPLRQLRGTWDIIFRTGAEGLSPIRQKINKSYLDNQPNLVENPAYALISETYVSKGNELDQSMKDAAIKYIMGAIKEADLDKAIDSWRKGGGDQIIKEYEDAWAKGQKK